MQIESKNIQIDASRKNFAWQSKIGFIMLGSE